MIRVGINHHVMKPVEKVFRPLESELRAYLPFYFSLLSGLNGFYEEDGRLCLEAPRNSPAAHYFASDRFQAYLKDFSQRNGDEVFLKVT
jgi:hypothetical protein